MHIISMSGDNIHIYMHTNFMHFIVGEFSILYLSIGYKLNKLLINVEHINNTIYLKYSNTEALRMIK